MTKRLFALRSCALFMVAAAVSPMWPNRAFAQEKPGAAPGAAQNQKSEQIQEDSRNWVTRVFELKFAQPGDLVRVLQMFSGRADFQRDLKVVMWSGPKELAPAVEDVVRRLDVAPAAPAQIELTVYLLSGSKHGEAGAALPVELEGVDKQVKGIFGLARLSLLETTILRMRSGSSGEAHGNLETMSDPGHATSYYLGLKRVSVTADERGKVISLDGLSLRLEVPVVHRTPDGKASSSGYEISTLRTDTEIREGQKVVVGKATVGGSSDTLFLVVTGKVVA